jgi:uncharacterized protein (DUF362 family)
LGRVKVAIVDSSQSVKDSFNNALKLIGDIEYWNTMKNPVIVKVGVFNHKGPKTNYPTVEVVDAITKTFKGASSIYLAESDNYKGLGMERLQIWKELFTERVIPFNLSTDKDTKEVEVGGEYMALSNVIFKPNFFVSTHALRKYDKGTILKNLFGLVPYRKKAKYHKILVQVLLDLFDLIGGVDLAVLDATRVYSGPAARKHLDTDILVVGEDAVAVEAVGAELVGLDPKKMDVIQEAMNRDLGEGDLEKIEIVGESIESVKDRFSDI